MDSWTTEGNSEYHGLGYEEENRPPELDPVGNRQVNEGQLLEFVVTAADPDDDNLDFSAENLPPGADFNPDTQTFSWTPGYSQAGNFPGITFTVEDNGIPPLSDSETITITVGNVNGPPELDPIGNKQVDEGQLLEFTITASDSDGNLFFSAGNLPPGADFNLDTQTFSWTPDFTQAGNYPGITFTVEDDGIPPLSDSETIHITVGNVNRPPELDPIGSKQVNEEQLLEFIITALDPDDDNLDYS